MLRGLLALALVVAGLLAFALVGRAYVAATAAIVRTRPVVLPTTAAPAVPTWGGAPWTINAYLPTATPARAHLRVVPAGAGDPCPGGDRPADGRCPAGR